MHIFIYKILYYFDFLFDNNFFILINQSTPRQIKENLPNSDLSAMSKAAAGIWSNCSLDVRKVRLQHKDVLYKNMTLCSNQVCVAMLCTRLELLTYPRPGVIVKFSLPLFLFEPLMIKSPSLLNTNLLQEAVS